MYDNNNIFAKIIAKEVPADFVYEDDKLIAIKDIEPQAPVHILVIPKGEYIDFEEFIEKASYQDKTHYYNTLKEIANKECGEHFRLVTNNGAWAGQTVFHFHTHILGGKNLAPTLG